MDTQYRFIRRYLSEKKREFTPFPGRKMKSIQYDSRDRDPASHGAKRWCWCSRGVKNISHSFSGSGTPNRRFPFFPVTFTRRTYALLPGVRSLFQVSFNYFLHERRKTRPSRISSGRAATDRRQGGRKDKPQTSLRRGKCSQEDIPVLRYRARVIQKKSISRLLPSPLSSHTPLAFVRKTKE